MDIVGPLPPTQGFQYHFTVVDRTTRWAEAFLLKDSSADSCIQTLIGWISRFGIPSHITSDRGSQFTSRLWLGIAKSLGYTLHHTTAYHPQANGMVERFHRNLKEALKARLQDNDWVLALPWVMFMIRTAPKEDLNCSAAEMVFGSTLTVLEEFISPTNRQRDAPTTKFLPTNTEFHGNSKCVPIKALETAAFVFVTINRHKTPLCRPYKGAFRVIRKGDKTFTIARKKKKRSYLWTDLNLPTLRIMSTPLPHPYRWQLLLQWLCPPHLLQTQHQPTHLLPTSRDMVELLNLSIEVLGGNCVVDLRVTVVRHSPFMTSLVITIDYHTIHTIR